MPYSIFDNRLNSRHMMRANLAKTITIHDMSLFTQNLRPRQHLEEYMVCLLDDMVQGASLTRMKLDEMHTGYEGRSTDHI